MHDKHIVDILKSNQIPLKLVLERLIDISDMDYLLEELGVDYTIEHSEELRTELQKAVGKIAY